MSPRGDFARTMVPIEAGKLFSCTVPYANVKFGVFDIVGQLALTSRPSNTKEGILIIFLA